MVDESSGNSVPSSPGIGEIATSFLRRAVLRDLSATQSAFAIESGLVIGGYRLLKVLRRGGMGEVWRAEHIMLGRPVAIKLMLPDRISPRAKQFFEREGRAGGRITHPHVVSVYDFGEANGVAFLVQELVGEGENFADLLDAMREADELPPGYYKQVAELLAAVAQGLQAVHDAGVVHRDVKPQNILVAAGSLPKVTDFGLSRIEDEASISRIGDLAGTYAYMSPEQVTLKHLKVDHRSDVFALGAVLYEALTLVRPFSGDTTQQLVQKILFDDPADPRVVRSKVPGDLAVIVAKAMEKNPSARYQTMRMFADDLTRFVQDRVILARPAGTLVKLAKWRRRNPTTAALMAAMLAFLAALGLMIGQVLAARSEAMASLNLARDEAVRATEVSDFVVEMFQFAMPELGSRYVHSRLTVKDLVERADRMSAAWPTENASSKAMNHAIVANLWLGMGDLEAARRQLATAKTLLDSGPRSLLPKGWIDLHLSRLAWRLDDRDPAVEDYARASIAAFDQLASASPRYGIYPRAWLSTHLFQTRRMTEAREIMLDAFVCAKRCTDPLATRDSVLRELDEMVDRVAEHWHAGRIENGYLLLSEYVESYKAAVGYDPLIPMGVAAVAMYLDYYRGDKERAEPLYRSCARLSRERLGAAHPVTLMLAQLASESVGGGTDAELISEWHDVAKEAANPTHALVARLRQAQGRLRETASNVDDRHRQAKRDFLAILADAEREFGSTAWVVVDARLEAAMQAPPFQSVQLVDGARVTSEWRTRVEAETLQATRKTAELCWKEGDRREFATSWAIRVHCSALASTGADDEALSWARRLCEVEGERCGNDSAEALSARMWVLWRCPPAERDEHVGKAANIATLVGSRTPRSTLESRLASRALLSFVNYCMGRGLQQQANEVLDACHAQIRRVQELANVQVGEQLLGLIDAYLRAGRWQEGVGMCGQLTLDTLRSSGSSRLRQAFVDHALSLLDSDRKTALERLEAVRVGSGDEQGIRAALLLAEDARQTGDTTRAKELADWSSELLEIESGRANSPSLVEHLARLEAALGRADQVRKCRDCLAAHEALVEKKRVEAERRTNEARRARQAASEFAQIGPALTKDAMEARQQALHCALKATELSPDNPNYRYALALAMRLTGRATEAKEAMDKAKDLAASQQKAFGFRSDSLDTATAVSLGLGAGEGRVLIEVTPGSTAELGGLRQGDILLRVGGQMATQGALEALKKTHAPFDVFSFEVRREGVDLQLEIAVGVSFP